MCFFLAQISFFGSAENASSFDSLSDDVSRVEFMMSQPTLRAVLDRKEEEEKDGKSAAEARRFKELGNQVEDE